MLLALALAQALAAAPTAPPHGGGAVYNGRLEQLQVRLPRLEAELRVDGALDEPEWARAAVLTGFSQFSPADGRPAEDSTEVLVWYSPTAIHFGVRAFEPHGAVRATLADRDRIAADDHVQIFLGTFNDGRQAMVFSVNALGVQSDGTLTESGQAGGGGGFTSTRTAVREAPDLSPDFVFQSKGRVTDRGYEVEVRIPFKSIRFQPSAEQRWGIQILRSVQHSGYEQTWTPAKRAAASFLAQSGTLEGLTGLRRGLVLDLNPVVTQRSAGSRSPDGGWRYDTDAPEPGGNVRWGVTNNLTLNGTVNPDFSQVEADAGQFTFDPRRALFFAEKRPFFLEGIEQFATPNSLIYTRRVVQPLGAAKLTGKVSGTDVAFLSAVDDRPRLATGRLATRDYPVFNILRVQRDVGRSSRIGLAYTDKVVGGDYNRVADVDGRIVFGRIYNAAFQGALSRTRRGETTITAPLWEARLNRNGRTFGFRYIMTGIDPEFEAQSGFVSRAGLAHANFSPRLTGYGRRGALVESYTGEVALDGNWNYDDVLLARGRQDEKLHINLNAALRGGWSAGASTLIENFYYDPGFYAPYRIERPLAGGGFDTVAFVGTPRLPNLDWVVRLATPQFKRFAADALYLWGRDENFFEWASADIIYATLNLNLRPTEQMRIAATYQHQQFNRTDGSLVGVGKIPRLKVEYQITRAVFVRVVGEYSASRQDALRDDSRTGYPLLSCPAGPASCVRLDAFSRNTLRGDWLFSYQPNPGTVFFAGYSSLRTEPDALRFDGLRRLTDGFFIKASYLFRIPHSAFEVHLWSDMSALPRRSSSPSPWAPYSPAPRRRAQSPSGSRVTSAS